MSLFKKQTGFMNKRQDFPKTYWIIIGVSIILAATAAILIPVPRKFKWLLFYALLLVFAFVGIMLYSKFGNSRGRR